MGLFNNDKKGKPPHTWYPEILHWREGDKIYCRNITRAIGYTKVKSQDVAKYIQPNDVVGKVVFTYKSVAEDGTIYVEDMDGHMLHFEFWRFIKVSVNETLKSRKIQQKRQGSERYMELMQNFQEAFDELQEEDDHPKRLGNKESE
ncbi:hypothetical protein AB2B38_007800 [Balneola sp. MJW-20]|uniref:hypothetical protein n=1 Tax=Gracilimonas aurantiaca TaxID=3234185 RepID=UPI0034650E7A